MSQRHPLESSSGSRYLIGADVQPNKLFVKVWSTETDGCWSGSWSKSYLEDLTTKSENPKSYQDFTQILMEAIESNQLHNAYTKLDLLSYVELLEKMHKTGVDLKTVKQSLLKKKYLILSCMSNAEDRNTHYPLALNPVTPEPEVVEQQQQQEQVRQPAPPQQNIRSSKQSHSNNNNNNNNGSSSYPSQQQQQQQPTGKSAPIVPSAQHSSNSNSNNNNYYYQDSKNNRSRLSQESPARARSTSSSHPHFNQSQYPYHQAQQPQSQPPSSTHADVRVRTSTNSEIHERDLELLQHELDVLREKAAQGAQLNRKLRKELQHSEELLVSERNQHAKQVSKLVSENKSMNEEIQRMRQNERRMKVHVTTLEKELQTLRQVKQQTGGGSGSASGYGRSRSSQPRPYSAGSRSTYTRHRSTSPSIRARPSSAGSNSSSSRFDPTAYVREQQQLRQQRIANRNNTSSSRSLSAGAYRPRNTSRPTSADRSRPSSVSSRDRSYNQNNNGSSGYPSSATAGRSTYTPPVNGRRTATPPTQRGGAPTRTATTSRNPAQRGGVPSSSSSSSSAVAAAASTRTGAARPLHSRENIENSRPRKPLEKLHELDDMSGEISDIDRRLTALQNILKAAKNNN